MRTSSVRPSASSNNFVSNKSRGCWRSSAATSLPPYKSASESTETLTDCSNSASTVGLVRRVKSWRGVDGGPGDLILDPGRRCAEVRRGYPRALRFVRLGEGKSDRCRRRGAASRARRSATLAAAATPARGRASSSCFALSQVGRDGDLIVHVKLALAY